MGDEEPLGEMFVELRDKVAGLEQDIEDRIEAIEHDVGTSIGVRPLAESLDSLQDRIEAIEDRIDNGS